MSNAGWGKAVIIAWFVVLGIEAFLTALGTFIMLAGFGSTPGAIACGALFGALTSSYRPEERAPHALGHALTGAVAACALTAMVPAWGALLSVLVATVLAFCGFIATAMFLVERNS